MNPDHAHFADWDAAYVLGALSPSDRRDFEAHLEACDRCRASISEIASTMGLLARVDRDRAESLLVDEPDAEDAAPTPGLRDTVMATALHGAGRRRRGWITAYVIAAVIALAVAISVPFTVSAGLRAGEVVALESVTSAPIEASVRLTSVGWGTKLDLECSYERGSDGSAQTWPYGLYVTSTDGVTSEVSSWRATAGKTARVSAGTALDVADIAAIEIRALGNGTVLMRTELEPAG